MKYLKHFLLVLIENVGWYVFKPTWRCSRQRLNFEPDLLLDEYARELWLEDYWHSRWTRRIIRRRFYLAPLRE